MARNKHLVVKSNDLVNARFDFTLTEMRVFYFVLSHVNPLDADFKEYEIDLREFAELIGTTNKGEYKRLRQITKDMMGQIIEVPIEEGYLQVGVFLLRPLQAWCGCGSITI